VPNMAMIWPSLPTRYFWKFHFTSPAIFSLGLVVRNLYSGQMSSPLTETFSNRSKVTFFLVRQNVLMSAFEPGSWLPKLLAGKARMRRPFSLYFLFSDSRPEYVGSVNPHLLATLTIRRTLPLYLASGTSCPSMSLTVKS